jgi:hypothetical protein
MEPCRVVVTVPAAVHAALTAESVRSGRTPAKVVADVLAKQLPDYLASEVRRALAPPLDIEARSHEREAVA